MGFSSTLAVPSPAHIESKLPDVSATLVVRRKQSFRGFSASSLSSLALGRCQNKRSSLGLSRKGLGPGVPIFADTDTVSDTSRPPSLITDDSSHTSSSSRSPSPEPSVAASRLEAAFKTYSATQSLKVLQTVLIPTLSQTHTDTNSIPSPYFSTTSLPTSVSRLSDISPSASLNSCLLEASDINVLFKWWNHLLLLSAPCPATFQAIYVIAAHPSLRNTIFWDAHYELTLSTTLCHPATGLSSSFFAKLIALGYIYHAPTSRLLRGLFTDPTKVSSSEPWVRRAKNVEVFVETSKHVFALAPSYCDERVIETRLEEMVSKVIHVTTYPNHRLVNLARLLEDSEGSFASMLENCLMRITRKIGAFDCIATFYLLDMLSSMKLTQTTFWIEVMQMILQTENHILQIRVFAFLYEHWSTFSSLPETSALILSPHQWEHFFTHWSGIVRDHYMRLLTYRACLTHPYEVRSMLMRSFETSLLENCQLRDCLPGNPIPNKHFVIRPLNSKQSLRRPALQPSPTTSPVEVARDEPVRLQTSPEAETTAGLIRKKLGLFRGLWTDEGKDETSPRTPSAALPALQNPKASTIVTETSLGTRPAHNPFGFLDEEKSSSATVQQYKFVPEYVGKQWSLTSDADAIRFLDSVMDAARDGRLPLHAFPLPLTEASVITSSSPSKSCVFLPLCAEDEEFIHPFVLGEGRKRLWTRSLSEWSTLLDETDRFWRICGGRSLPSPAPSSPLSPGPQIRTIICPKLEVEFPRWFVQRSTQVAGDGLDRA